MADTAQNPTPNQPANDAADKQIDEVAEATKQQIHQDLKQAQSLSAFPDMQDTIIDIERDLLKQIIERLDENKMSPEEAKKLAQEFISFLPIKDQKDLLDKPLKLSRDNSATKGIYLKYAKPYEENERLRKIELMRKHLHAGNIEHAIAIAKGGQTNG